MPPLERKKSALEWAELGLEKKFLKADGFYQLDNVHFAGVTPNAILVKFVVFLEGAPAPGFLRKGSPDEEV